MGGGAQFDQFDAPSAASVSLAVNFKQKEKKREKRNERKGKRRQRIRNGEWSEEGKGGAGREGIKRRSGEVEDKKSSKQGTRGFEIALHEAGVLRRKQQRFWSLK